MEKIINGFNVCGNNGNNGKPKKILYTIEEKYSNNNFNECNIKKEIKEKDKIIKSVSFSGGGYNCVYHLGVVKYIFENTRLFENTIYLGASGGAGIIGIILCYENDHERLKIVDTIISEIIKFRGMKLKLHEQVDKYSKLIESYITKERFEKYIKNKKRCHISVTEITRFIPKNHVICDFDNYEIYLETLRASACIPFILDSKFRKINNKTYLDGGLTNNMPILDENTIRISCIIYPFLRADVYPKIISDIKYSFIAPEMNYILNMYNLGYSNIEVFCKDKKKYIDQVIADDRLINDIKKIINNDDFLN